VEDKPRHRRIGRVIGLTAIALGAVLCLVIPAAIMVLNGPRLGRMVSERLPGLELRGSIAATSITVRPGALLDLLFDRPSRVVVEGLRIVDPEGTEVLFAPRVQVSIRPRSAFGLQVILSQLVLDPGARWRFAQMHSSPQIGFLAAFSPRFTSTLPGSGEKTVFRFEITDARLGGLAVRFDFPGAWGLDLRDVHNPQQPASLLVDGRDPFYVGFSAPDLEARGGGFLDIVTERLPWDHLKVRKVETTRAHPDDIFLDVESADTGASRLTARGFFKGLYGYGLPDNAIPPPPGISMHVQVDDAAPALRAVAKPHGIAGLTIAGDHATVSADLSGRFLALQIDGQLSGIDVDYQGRPARNLKTGFSLNVADPITAELKDLSFDGGSGGNAQLGAKLRWPKLTTRLTLQHFGTSIYLPQAARKALTGLLEGHLGVGIDFAKPALSLDDVDMHLDHAATGRKASGMPARLRVKGRAHATPNSASTEGLTFELPGAVVTAKGRYGLAHQVLGFGLRATAAQLPRLLSTWGLPPLGRSATMDLEVGGQISNPHAKGSISVEGVALGPLPLIDLVQARLGLDSGLATIEALRGTAWGGAVEAQGSARLWERSWLRPLRAPQLKADLTARGIDLAKVLPGADVQGLIDLNAHGAGTPAAFSAKATVPNQPLLKLLGESWKLIGCEVDADGVALAIRRARLERVGGGAMELSGRAEWDGPIKVGVNIEGVPVGALPGLAKAGVPAEGRLSAHLDVRGTYLRPLVEGDIALDRVAIRGVQLGNGRIKVRPTDSGGVVATGDLFNRISVGGAINYGPAGPLVTAKARLHNILLEQFFPELASFGDARGRMTGEVDFSYGGANPTTVDVKLTELELSAARDLTGAGGAKKSGRLSVHNATPIRVILAGSHLVVDRTRLVTEGGDLRLWGEIKDDVVNAELAGALDLELLQAFLGNRVESLGGEVDLSLRVRGTPRHPLGEGSLNVVRPIAARLPGIAPVLRVPAGSIKLDPEALTLANLAIEAEGAQLRLAGKAQLGPRQDLRGLDFTATGDLSGALLEALARGALADAAGKARVDARIQGTGAAPKIGARIDLTGLSFRLRDLGRDIAMESGVIELAGMDVSISNLRARVDGQGEFVVGMGSAGRIGLRGTWPSPTLGTVKLPVQGQRLSLRLSNAVELDDVGLDIRVSGEGDHGFALDGEVTVASGRYIRDFNVRELVITPSIDESEVQPFYAGNPLLEKLALRLRLRTLGDSFVVQNNLVPELHMSFDLLVHGTLVQPRIAGLVRPTEGQFHLFGVRQNFELVPNVNQITFVETKSLERGETPELNLEAESLVTDTAGRDHLVRMRITGAVGQAHIDLSTNTGLDRSQALLLLVSGRTGDTDTALGGGAGGGTSAAGLGGGGTDVIGQLFADILEPYIDGPLQKVTGGKILLRPTLGPEGLELRLDARMSRQFDLRLTYLRGLETRSLIRGESSLWLMDYLTLRGLGEQVSYSPQQGLVEDARSLKLELSMDFPIRFFSR
jgi:autotransporter translocation and assembly factor TamB